MTEQDIFTLTINEPLCAEHGFALNAQFLAGNRLAINAQPRVLSGPRFATAPMPVDTTSNVHIIAEEFIYGDKTMRGLVAESGTTFTALQALKQVGQNSEYVRISQAYRSIIRACLESLNRASSVAEVRGEAELCSKYNEHISIFYSIEFIWHLCEILCIDSAQAGNGVIVEPLMDWIRFHFSKAECMATELLMLGQDASDGDNYWPCLTLLVMQGQIEAVRMLLKLHPAADSEAFKVADQIFRTIPKLNTYSSSLTKFRSQWDYWMTDASTKLSANTFKNELYLENLIKLMTCDDDTWNTMITESESWYELLPGFIFYTNPICKSYELGDIANTFLNRWSRLKGSNVVELKRLDYTLLNLFESDMKSVLNSLQLMTDNQWFSTHLIDLMYNCGHLKVLVAESDVDPIALRHSLVSEYGRCLMTRDSFWQLGVDYLEHCPDGEHFIKTLLLHLPLRTEKVAQKVLAYCQHKNFVGVVEDICKILSRRSYDQQQYGNGLEWAIRSKDEIVVSNFADFILGRYAETGELCCLDVIANVGAKMFISPRLVFLTKYFEFHELYRKGDLRAAADILVNLLDSNETPYFLWPTIFMDALPLLENKEHVLSIKHVEVILKHIASYLMSSANSKKATVRSATLKDYRIDDMEAFILKVRYACAQNVARAKVREHGAIDDAAQAQPNLILNSQTMVI